MHLIVDGSGDHDATWFGKFLQPAAAITNGVFCRLRSATSIRRVTDIMGEISAASTEQSTGVAQVGEAVSQMDQVTQQNAALVEESAAAAEEIRSVLASRSVLRVSAVNLLSPPVRGELVARPARRGEHRGGFPVELPGGTRVVACGLDVVYPSEHRELWQQVGRVGLLLSDTLTTLTTNTHATDDATDDAAPAGGADGGSGAPAVATSAIVDAETRPVSGPCR